MNKSTTLRSIARSLLVLSLCFTSIASFANKAPEFSITTIDNDVVKLDHKIKDKPIYLVFWATWCPSCLREVPTLKSVYQEYKDDINFVAINVDRTHFWYNLTTEESKKPVRKYLEEHGINYPVALDDDKILSDLYDVKGTPTQVLISKQGELIAKFHTTPEDIRSTLKQLVEQE